MAAPSEDKVYAKVKKGLEATPFEPSKLTELAGGSVNFTYEATLAKPLDDGAKTVFIKHAEPCMKVRPETTLPPDRGTLIPLPFVPPKYYSFIEYSSTQILEYMPEGTTLKEFIPKYFGHATTPKESDAREIGKTVGSWLKWFRQLTANDAEMHTIAGKNELGRFFRHIMMIPDAAIPKHGNNVSLFVVDWEMSMPAGRWMMESMVEAYGPLTEEFAFRTAIQVGAHLVCVITDLNRVPTDQLEKAAATGKEILVHAWKKDRAWFENSDFACLFRQTK
ncbi:unnamed protein product [Clonostachys chloroleuca]|uniref:Aminoglycoside phosphotransferase domain-containing protein n=1 Tax=Clonostachys chloroleuca TaxID=1926264 RepID=A0AA35LPU2_9HYPO|nr:unnamed protein product [Clonostachys chloroleuca]